MYNPHNIRLEIITVSQRGVLPVVSLLNSQFGNTRYKDRRYDLSLGIIWGLTYKGKANFDDKNWEHWEAYFYDLRRLTVEHDIYIVEHLYGLYAIPKYYERYKVREFILLNCIPLRIDDPEAKKARDKGLLEVAKQFNSGVNDLFV